MSSNYVYFRLIISKHDQTSEEHLVMSYYWGNMWTNLFEHAYAYMLLCTINLTWHWCAMLHAYLSYFVWCRLQLIRGLALMALGGGLKWAFYNKINIPHYFVNSVSHITKICPIMAKIHVYWIKLKYLVVGIIIKCCGWLLNIIEGVGPESAAWPDGGGKWTVLGGK